MMKLYRTLSLLLLALAFTVPLSVIAQENTTTFTEANCPHGLSATDIANRSGLDLTGKTALVTGGRSGLGYAITEALLQQNCTVIIASRNIKLNEEAVAQLKMDMPDADISYEIMDLEDFDNVKAFASEFIANHTRLDYYFGNAGQGGSGAQPFTINGYERIFQVNYIAQVLLIEELLPLLRKSQPSRIMLTGSSSHSLACGTLQLSTGNFTEPSCFDDTSMAMSGESAANNNDDMVNAMDIFPFDQKGLDAINSTFGCPLLAGTYPVSKYLMIELVREISRREAAAGNQVYAYSWAPGNINTDLNPWASCCVGPVEWMGPTCRYELPYVGPKDEQGNPNPPNPRVNNHWSSPKHGVMSAIYAALHADPSEAGSFFATYWECEANKGYFPQGISSNGRAEIYEQSLIWANNDAPVQDDIIVSGTIMEEEEEVKESTADAVSSAVVGKGRGVTLLFVSLIGWCSALW